MQISFHNSEEATILITVHRHDVDLELSVLHSQLRSALLQMLQNETIAISRFGNLNKFVTWH